MRFNEKHAKTLREQKEEAFFFTRWEPAHHFSQTVVWNFYLDKKWTRYFEKRLKGGPCDMITVLKNNFF